MRWFMIAASLIALTLIPPQASAQEEPQEESGETTTIDGEDGLQIQVEDSDGTVNLGDVKVGDIKLEKID